METGPLTYTLNTWQFQQALAILQREQQANMPSPRQEKIFKQLHRTINVFGIVVLTFFLSIVFSVISFVVGTNRFDFFYWLSLISLIVSIICSTAFILSTAVIIILFFLNLPYQYFGHFLSERGEQTRPQTGSMW
jgi:hypothetical protein